MARVAVDVPLPHLDRAFDYVVPEPMSAAAQPGVRVRVRFAGQDVDGWVLERSDGTEHAGRLAPLRRVVSAEPALTPQVLALARAVADRYAGTLGDVLRLAVPPRHARTEGASGGSSAPSVSSGSSGSSVLKGPAGPPYGAVLWSDYAAGQAFLGRLAAGQSPRAVWTALPGAGWADAVAAAVAATVGSGRGALVVVPDRRDVDLLEQALVTALGPDRHARLEADLGPAARYAAFLRLLRGQVRVAIGTRAAAFAPVADLGLVVIWDDGDEQHAEPRAPYPHAREVLRLRAEQTAAAALFGGWSCSVEAAALLGSGWARPIEADRSTLRARWPRVAPAGDGRPDDDPAAQAARMPPAAWRAVHDGLARGPVLVQVARSGYVPGTGCQSCRRPARCPHCQGPVMLPAPRDDGLRTPECGWCGRALPAWTCPTCQGRRLRARAIGVERTAEELGRAFPGARVLVSRPDRQLPRVPPGRTLVLATAGIEPIVEGGYAAAVLLDGDLLLERPDLRAGEEALRRWRAAAALVRPATEGGVVLIGADPAAPAVQALIRSDPGGFAARELAERADLGLPPAAAVATVDGAPAVVRSFLDAARLPADVVVLGPVPHPPPTPHQPAPHQLAPHQPAPHRPAPHQPAPHQPTRHPPQATPVGVPEQVRMVLRVPSAQGAALARALHDAAAVRSARREPAVRIQIDPRDLG